MLDSANFPKFASARSELRMDLTTLMPNLRQNESFHEIRFELQEMECNNVAHKKDQK